MTQAERYIAFLSKFKGYLEKETNENLEDFTANAGDENFTLFGKWYDDFFETAGFNGAAWCHDFVSYGAYKVGITPEKIPYTASCGEGVRWFKKNGLWRDRQNYAPMMGDIAYFHWGDGIPAHVGAVRYTSGGWVHTIEGNTGPGNDEGEEEAITLVDNGGRVSMKKYPLDYSCILGYGTPNYDMEDDEMDISKLTDEQVDSLLDRIMTRLSGRPVSDYAVESCKKGVESKIFMDNDKDGLVDMPRAFVTRQDLAVTYNRLGLFDK
jgi:hypothetical protein